MRAFHEVSLLGLFSPFAVLAELVSVAMLVLHGPGWLAMKLGLGPVRSRAMRVGTWAAVAVIVLYAAGGLWLAYGDLGFAIAGAIDTAGSSAANVGIIG